MAKKQTKKVPAANKKAPAKKKAIPVKNPVGRPKEFATPEDLKARAKLYFKDVDSHPWYKNEAVKSGESVGLIIKVPMQRPYTLIGLCHFLGVNSQYFRDFKANLKQDDDVDKEFSLVVATIEEKIRNQKFEGAVVGVFNASIISQDLGMINKQQIDLKGEMTNKKADLSKLTDEQLRQRAAIDKIVYGEDA